MVDKVSSSVPAKNWKEVANFKLVDKKYYIKNYFLGRGNFAETYLATLVEDEN